MFWVFVLAIGVALTFSTLGALSVWVKIFIAGGKILLFVAGVVTLAFLWKHFLKSKSIKEGKLS